MKIVRTIKEMIAERELLNKEQKTIGFVPTMGYLHDGHRRLIQEARKQNDIVIVSIFVNPLQFNQSTDLESYPRDFERDEKILQNDGVDYIFYPTQNEMYPKPLSIKMDVVNRTDVLCGKSRPGHFEGVVTVLTKLFNIIHPNKTYFGLKDAQQVAVVDALIKDFNYNIELVPVVTVRESDGLALSSRNVNLLPQEREEAKHIYQSLLKGKNLIKNNNHWRRTDVIHEVTHYLSQHITGEIDYVDCLNFPQLSDDINENHDIIIAVAIQYKKARLIDNIILQNSGQLKYGSDS
ncbi:pantoate--beta-alanine ligase [Bacillaceae bacterium W0354]